MNDYKYELDDGQLTDEQYRKIKELAEYELDKSTGEVVKKYVDILKNDGFKKVKKMDKLLTIPKEKPLHRIKDGAKFTLPLNQQEIIQLLKSHQWNVDDKDAVDDITSIFGNGVSTALFC